jgi:hypothetical protein
MSSPSKSSHSKRQRRQRNNNNNSAVWVSRYNNVSPYPVRMHSTLQYSSQFVLTTGAAGIVAASQWRLNSVFDPDYTNVGTNHQPYGYDQLYLLYNRYRVMAAKYTIKVVGSAAVQPSLISITCNPISGPTGTVDLAGESPYSQTAWVCPSVERTFTKLIQMHTLYGQTIAQYTGDDSTESVVGGNPSTPAFLTIHISNPGTLTSAYINVHIDYYTDFFEIQQQTQS